MSPATRPAASSSSQVCLKERSWWPTEPSSSGRVKSCLMSRKLPSDYSSQDSRTDDGYGPDLLLYAAGGKQGGSPSSRAVDDSQANVVFELEPDRHDRTDDRD